MKTLELIAAIHQLSVEERLRLIGEIWDSLSTSPEAFELTDVQRAELDRRIQAHRESPDDVMEWEDVKAWIRSGA